MRARLYALVMAIADRIDPPKITPVPAPASIRYYHSPPRRPVARR